MAQIMIMAMFDGAIFLTQMESVALAIAEHRALFADAGLHPPAVTEGTVAVFPYIPEVVFVDVSLRVVGSDAGTGAYGTVDKYRSD